MGHERYKYYYSMVILHTDIQRLSVCSNGYIISKHLVPLLEEVVHLLVQVEVELLVHQVLLSAVVMQIGLDTEIE